MAAGDVETELNPLVAEPPAAKVARISSGAIACVAFGGVALAGSAWWSSMKPQAPLQAAAASEELVDLFGDFIPGFDCEEHAKTHKIWSGVKRACCCHVDHKFCDHPTFPPQEGGSMPADVEEAFQAGANAAALGEFHVHNGVPGYGCSRAPMLRFPYGHLDKSMYDMYPPFMIGTTWGVDDCVGLDDKSPSNTRKSGCVTVKRDTNGDGLGDGIPISRVPTVRVAKQLFSTGSQRPGPIDHLFPMDAWAVKFSWPIDRDTIKWNALEAVLENGNTIKPVAVTCAPARDENECSTIVAYGQFADSTCGNNGIWNSNACHTTTSPVKYFRVVKDLIAFNGTHRFNVKGAYFGGDTAWERGNLDFKLGGVLAVGALRSYKPALNPFDDGRMSCPKYPLTTHVLQAMGIGGLSKDGVNAFNKDQLQLFTILKKDGNQLRRSAMTTLADIDGDDFTDICLKMSDAEAAQLDTLIMNCDPSDPLKNWALPHGNAQGFAPCTHTKPQKIAHIKCPESPYCR